MRFCVRVLIFITASLLDSNEKRVFLEFIEKKQQCSLLCVPQKTITQARSNVL